MRIFTLLCGALLLSGSAMAQSVDAENIKKVFEVNPSEDLGLSAPTETNTVSLALVGSNLVVCEDNGKTPIYIDALTGEKGGEIVLGDAKAGAVTSDEAGNMLIVNHAAAGEVVNIYTTASVTDAPSLLYSFTNETDLAMGSQIKVTGNIKENALITIILEGVEGVTGSARFTAIQVAGGKIEHSVVDLSATTDIMWSHIPQNEACVVPVATNPAAGIFVDYYDGKGLTYVNGMGEASEPFTIHDWSRTPNSLDSKKIDGRQYLVSLSASLFPNWAITPLITLFDITDPASFANNQIAQVEGGVNCYDESLKGFGDVLLAAAPDNSYIAIYYYDHYAHVLGCFAAPIVTEPEPEPAPALYVRGEFNNWGTDDPMKCEMWDAITEFGVFTATVAKLKGEFKIATADWSTSYGWSGDNAPVFQNGREAEIKPVDGEKTNLVFDEDVENVYLEYMMGYGQYWLTLRWDESGIEDVKVDAAPVIYYNLQGVEVENPTNGLYIARQGNKSTKVYVK